LDIQNDEEAYERVDQPGDEDAMSRNKITDTMVSKSKKIKAQGGQRNECQRWRRWE
jgi:hypothetical protein